MRSPKSRYPTSASRWEVRSIWSVSLETMIGFSRVGSNTAPWLRYGVSHGVYSYRNPRLTVRLLVRRKSSWMNPCQYVPDPPHHVAGFERPALAGYPSTKSAKETPVPADAV